MTNVDTPIVDRLEVLLKTPLPHLVDEADWHEHAADIFIPNDSDLPPKILAAGTEVLAGLPLDDIEAMLSSLRLSPEDISKIKNTRRIVMIGRDAVCLTAVPPLPAAVDPYILLAKKLGVIADSHGQDQQAIRNTLEIVRNTDRQALQPNGLVAHTPEDLRTECNRRYKIPTLLNRHPAQSRIEFHSARVGHRRAVHLGVVACAVEETPDKLQYLASGLQLNKIYGSFHEQVLGGFSAETSAED